MIEMWFSETFSGCFSLSMGCNCYLITKKNGHWRRSPLELSRNKITQQISVNAVTDKTVLKMDVLALKMEKKPNIHHESHRGKNCVLLYIHLIGKKVIWCLAADTTFRDLKLTNFSWSSTQDTAIRQLPFGFHSTLICNRNLWQALITPGWALGCFVPNLG